MAQKVSIDSSELRTLAADIHAIPERLGRHVVPVVERGARNIKEAWRDDARSSEHFSPIAHSITYDVHQTSFGGTGAFEAEIGPVKGRTGRSAGNRRGGTRFNDSDFSEGGVSPGALANIWIFGTSRGGGSGLPPETFLDDEAPAFEKHLGDVLEDLL